MKLRRSFASVTLLEGNTVTLSCIPSILETALSWAHNGKNVNEDENISFSPLNRNHSLILNNASLNDSGVYTCHVALEDKVVEENISVIIVAGILIATVMIFMNRN